MPPAKNPRIGLSCPVCGARQHEVIETRPGKDFVRRRRKCFNGHLFTAYELVLGLENASPRRKVPLQEVLLKVVRTLLSA